MTLPNGSEPVEGWRIRFRITKGAKAEAYRVADNEQKLAFLKVFNSHGLKQDRLDSTGRPLELAIIGSLKCPGIPGLIQSGLLHSGGRPYFITDLVPGETLEMLLLRKFALSEDRAKPLLEGLLEIAAYLHALEDPVIHNALMPVNIILDECTDGGERLVLVGFGHARRVSDGPAESALSVSPYYVPNECFEGAISSPTTDVFALGATYYRMLFGAPPWADCTAAAKPSNLRNALREARLQPASIPSHTLSGKLDPSSRNAIRKALSRLPDDRFENAATFLEALSEPASRKVRSVSWSGTGHEGPNEREPGGFAAVAGMTELKRILTEDFLNALRKPELYRRFGLSIPNGMLLFGPPGCGKTYVAERFSEELGFAFRKISPSTVATIYIHGTQEKIAQLFDAARNDAPCVLFLDEVDALVPCRTGGLHHAYAAEVNEWLAQMSNCGEAGIFLLAATNQPRRIDGAVLRAGRIDKVVYVGPPDHEARRAMFEIHLSQRPLEDDIDFGELARMTEARVASDIKLLVDEAARDALTSGDRCIGMPHLQDAIRRTGPTVGPGVLAEFERMRHEFESRRPMQRAALSNRLDR